MKNPDPQSPGGDQSAGTDESPGGEPEGTLISEEVETWEGDSITEDDDDEGRKGGNHR